MTLIIHAKKEFHHLLQDIATLQTVGIKAAENRVP